MSRIAVKICGLSTPETLDAALKGGASHVGFVHFAKSPRHVEAERLAALAARVPGHVQKVGVVVNPEDAQIEQLMQAGRLDALQLHGSEPPERVAAIRARFPGLKLWKAIPVKTTADIASAARYADIADMILFDAKTLIMPTFPAAWACASTGACSRPIAPPARGGFQAVSIPTMSRRRSASPARRWSMFLQA